MQVGPPMGWRTRPKGGSCELGDVEIGALCAAPGVSKGGCQGQNAYPFHWTVIANSTAFL